MVKHIAIAKIDYGIFHGEASVANLKCNVTTCIAVPQRTDAAYDVVALVRHIISRVALSRERFEIASFITYLGFKLAPGAP